MQKEIYKSIGKLLKIADDVHLSYYEYRGRMKRDTVPSILVGGDCLSLIISNPFHGLKNLQKRLNPFLTFCDSIRKKGDSTDRERSLYGSHMKKFNNEYQRIFENEDVVKNCCVSSLGKSIIIMEYLS